MVDLLEHKLYAGTVLEWSVASALAAAAMAGFYAVKSIAVRRLSRKADRNPMAASLAVAADAISNINPLFVLAASVYLGSLALTLLPAAERILGKIMVIAFLLQMAIWSHRFLTLWLTGYLDMQKNKDRSNSTVASLLGFIGKVVLWSLTVLLILDNAGVDVTALVASLGVGGIAVALAIQNILGDIFASLSIAVDKPFVVGDFIIVDNSMGTVEHIGLKTTRVRSLSGEQIVFSNTDLLKSRIHNYKRMYERRVQFQFGVIYQTSIEKLKRIPSAVRSIIESQNKARFDRAHFKEYGDSALLYEVVYYVGDPDYNVYMDIQQEINLSLFGYFEREKIGFAYPTRTLVIDDKTLSMIRGAA